MPVVERQEESSSSEDWDADFSSGGEEKAKPLGGGFKLQLSLPATLLPDPSLSKSEGELTPRSLHRRTISEANGKDDPFEESDDDENWDDLVADSDAPLSLAPGAGLSLQQFADADEDDVFDDAFDGDFRMGGNAGEDSGDDEDWDADLDVAPGRLKLSLPASAGSALDELPSDGDGDEEIKITGIRADPNAADEAWDDDFDFADGNDVDGDSGPASREGGRALSKSPSILLTRSRTKLFGFGGEGPAFSGSDPQLVDSVATTKAVAAARKILREFSVKGLTPSPSPPQVDVPAHTASDKRIVKLKKRIKSAKESKDYCKAARYGADLADMYFGDGARDKTSATLTAAYRAARRDTESDEGGLLRHRILFLMGLVAEQEGDCEVAIDQMRNSIDVLDTSADSALVVVKGKAQAALASCLLAQVTKEEVADSSKVQGVVVAFVESLRTALETPQTDLDWSQVASSMLSVARCLRLLASPTASRSVVIDIRDATEQLLRNALSFAASAKAVSIEKEAENEFQALQQEAAHFERVFTDGSESANPPSTTPNLSLGKVEEFPDELAFSSDEGEHGPTQDDGGEDSDSDWDAEIGLDPAQPAVSLKLSLGLPATTKSPISPKPVLPSEGRGENAALVSAIPKRYRLLLGVKTSEPAIVKYPKATLLWSLKTVSHDHLDISAGLIFLQGGTLVRWLRSLIPHRAGFVSKTLVKAQREKEEDGGLSSRDSHNRFGEGLPRLSASNILMEASRKDGESASGAKARVHDTYAEPSNLRLENLRQELRYKLKKREIHSVKWAQAYLDYASVLYAMKDHSEELWDSLIDFFTDLRTKTIPNKPDVDVKEAGLHAVVFQMLYIACKVWRPEENESFQAFLKAVRRLSPGCASVATLFELEVRSHFEYDIEHTDFAPVAEKLCEIMADHDPLLDSKQDGGLQSRNGQSRADQEESQKGGKKGRRDKKSRKTRKSKKVKKAKKSSGHRGGKSLQDDSEPLGGLEHTPRAPVRKEFAETMQFTDNASIFVRAAVDLHFLLEEISPLSSLHRDLDTIDRRNAARLKRSRSTKVDDVNITFEEASGSSGEDFVGRTRAVTVDSIEGDVAELDERIGAYFVDEHRMERVFELYPSLEPSILKARAAYALGHFAVSTLEDYSLAEQLFFECVYILDTLKGASHGTHPLFSELGCNALLRYAEVLLQNDKYVYSIVAFEAGIALKRIRTSRRHHSYTMLIRQVAKITLEQRDTRRAIEYQCEVLDVYSQNHRFNEVILVCEQISSLYQELGDFPNAEKYLWFALNAVKDRTMALAKDQLRDKSGDLESEGSRASRRLPPKTFSDNSQGTLRARRATGPSEDPKDREVKDLLLSFGSQSADRLDPTTFRLLDKMTDLLMKSYHPDRALEILEGLQRVQLPQQQHWVHTILPKLARSYISRRWFKQAKDLLDRLDKEQNITLFRDDGAQKGGTSDLIQDDETALEYWGLSARLFFANGQYSDALYCVDQASCLCPAVRLTSVAGYLVLRGRLLMAICARAGTSAVQFPTQFAPSEPHLARHLQELRAVHDDDPNALGDQLAKFLLARETTFSCTGDCIQECIASFDRAYQYYRAISDDASIAKVTAFIAETYLQHVFPAVALLRVPLSEVSILRAFVPTPLSAPKADDAPPPTELVISLEKIEGPADCARELVADLAHFGLAPKVYLNMAELCFLKGDRVQCLGYWDAARRLTMEFHTSDNCTLLSKNAVVGYRKLEVVTKRLVRLLLCFEKSVINDHLQVIDFHLEVQRCVDRTAHAPFQRSLVNTYEKAVQSERANRQHSSVNAASDSPPPPPRKQIKLRKKTEGGRTLPRGSDLKSLSRSPGKVVDSLRGKKGDTDGRPRVDGLFDSGSPPTSPSKQPSQKIFKKKDTTVAARLTELYESSAETIWGLMAAGELLFSKGNKGQISQEEVATESRRIMARIRQARRIGEDFRLSLNMSPLLSEDTESTEPSRLSFDRLAPRHGWVGRLLFILQLDEVIVSYVPATGEKRFQRMGGRHDDGKLDTDDENNTDVLHLHIHLLSSVYEYATLKVSSQLTLDKVLHTLVNTPYSEGLSEEKRRLFGTFGKTQVVLKNRPQFVSETENFQQRLESLTSLLFMRSQVPSTATTAAASGGSWRHRMLTPAELSQLGVAKKAVASADPLTVASSSLRNVKDLNDDLNGAAPRGSSRPSEAEKEEETTEDGVALLPKYIPVTSGSRSQAEISIAECFSEPELKAQSSDNPLQLYVYLRGNTAEYEAHSQSQVLNRTVFLTEEMTHYVASAVRDDLISSDVVGGKRDQVTSQRVVEDFSDYVFSSLVSSTVLRGTDEIETELFFRTKLATAKTGFTLTQMPISLICSKSLHAFPWELIIGSSVMRSISLAALVRQATIKTKLEAMSKKMLIRQGKGHRRKKSFDIRRSAGPKQDEAGNSSRAHESLRDDESDSKESSGKESLGRESGKSLDRGSKRSESKESSGKESFGRESGKAVDKGSLKRDKFAPRVHVGYVPTFIGVVFPNHDIFAEQRDDIRRDWILNDTLNRLNVRGTVPDSVRTASMLLPMQSAVLRNRKKPPREFRELKWMNLDGVTSKDEMLSKLDTYSKVPNPVLVVSFADLMEANDALEHLMLHRAGCTVLAIPHKKFALVLHHLLKLRSEYLRNAPENKTTPYAWFSAAIAVVQNELSVPIAVFNPPSGVSLKL